MATGLVVHIEVGGEKHTEVLSLDRIRIGASANCDLCFEPSLLPIIDSPVIELVRTNDHYRVGDFNRSLSITHNGTPLTYGSIIEDGDEMRIEQSEILIQFYPVQDVPAPVSPRGQMLVAPFIENAAIEAAATARRDDAKVFLREFTRELIREINTSTKVLTFLLATALVGGVLYLGFSASKEFQRIRHLNDEQKSQLTHYEGQLKKLIDELGNVSESNDRIIGSLSVAPKVYSSYSSGVCLILGKYQFFETGTNRPLRYPDLQVTEEGATLQSGDDQQQTLTPDGNGPIAEFTYFGTGFHVGDGYVLTNRHIAYEPWKADESTQSLSSAVVGRPRIVSLMAYFPGQRNPIQLRSRQASRSDDLAVCVLENREQLPSNIPTLPLDPDSDASGVGKSVVLMGYPTAHDRILANLPEAEARDIRNRYGSSFDALIGRLSELNLIKPATSQGHINDLQGRRIVYDARTAEGGSGAPLFGQYGRVIGVNFQLFALLADSNQAVPIRYAVTLLERAGWKSTQESADPNTNNNSAPASTSSKDGRPAASPTPPNQSR